MSSINLFFIRGNRGGAMCCFGIVELVISHVLSAHNISLSFTDKFQLKLSGKSRYNCSPRIVHVWRPSSTSCSIICEEGTRWSFTPGPPTSPLPQLRDKLAHPRSNPVPKARIHSVRSSEIKFNSPSPKISNSSQSK